MGEKLSFLSGLTLGIDSNNERRSPATENYFNIEFTLEANEELIAAMELLVQECDNVLL